MKANENIKKNLQGIFKLWALQKKYLPKSAFYKEQYIEKLGLPLAGSITYK